jgi:2-C-methyl-D-erythritol 4-phosphate cytidylyltransferase
MASVQRPSSAIDKEEDVEMVYALIVAGGSGSRLGGPSPKQYLPLAGVPMLVRTVAVFDRCEVIDTLVLVVPAGDMQFVRESLLTAAGLRKAVLLCSGGTRRQDSVFNGLACIPDDDSLVVIHDAVRPLVTCECITACVDAARAQGAGIAAVPAWDTLKRVSNAGTIDATLPREDVWLAQTPQAFRTGLIRTAHHAARSQNFQGTDDASLVERQGGSVRVVPGSRRNIKITTSEDMALAEALLDIRSLPSGHA